MLALPSCSYTGCMYHLPMDGIARQALNFADSENHCLYTVRFILYDKKNGSHVIQVIFIT